ALVLAAPLPLLARRLSATAESVAVVGLVLTVGDVYLFQHLVMPRPSLLTLAALSVVLAIGWAAYGTATRLTGPRLAAIGLAQLPAPLAITGVARLAGGSRVPLAGSVAAGLIVSSALDVLLIAWLSVRGVGHATEDASRPPRRRDVASTTASIAAAAAWMCGILIATMGLIAGPIAWWPIAGWPAVTWLAGVSAAAAVVGIEGPCRCPALASVRTPAAAVSGALAALSLGLPLAAALPARWALAVIGAGGLGTGALAVAVRRGRGPGLDAPAAPAGQSGGGSGGRALGALAAGSAAVLACTGLVAASIAVADLLPAR